jgi:hypothetical protein
MKTIIILIVLTILLFSGFLISLIIGLIKKRKSLIITSIFIFIIFIGFGGWTGLTITKKSINKVKETLKPRTGKEIYIALFGAPTDDCVKVINKQDQEFPVIDYAIWLHFETCPIELKRILSQHDYRDEKISTMDWSGDIPSGENIDWFNPKSIGDTILVFEYSTNSSRNIQTIWTSVDSTIVYCRDIND